ncbi:hypothetical protein [Maribellus sediminis]|uniref:hypothetical protein n=1 Tax=Maribellus sediminis TaxID=2696285 RepID=UPI0014318376|nr:hypothetical protein [Maribellus sediminis]
MSNLDDYNAKLSEINALTEEETMEPTEPVAGYLQGVENLYHWALDDAPQLNVVGISNESISELPVYAGACREAQSIWNKNFRSQKEAQKQWNELSPAAYQLRDDLLATMRYAYRLDPALLNRVRAISEGYGHADMIQDLNDLAVLGKENPGLLEAIGEDLSRLDTAATTADEMADLLAEANGDKAEQNDSKVIRDKAFTLLKIHADAIREAGKFVFRNDSARYRGYTNTYWQKRKRSSSATTVSEEAE